MWFWAVPVVLCAFAVVPGIIHLSRTRLQDDLTGNSEAVIVFAHPDDETMFFLPLISLLHRIGLKFRLLCLSTGDYDGLGKARAKELMAVSRRLRSAGCDVLHKSGLPDGPHYWESKHVTSAVEEYLLKHPKIDTIFTFDSYGVSGHPNHISVFRGVSALKTGRAVYTLDSVSIWRKYVPVVDFLVTLLNPCTSLVAVNVGDPFQSLSVMKLYATQNVWFRKLLSLFSKYSYINEFHRL